MDNVGISHYKGLVNATNKEGIQVMDPPPYPQFINPIENAFSNFKNYILRGASRNESEFKNAIDNSFNNHTK